MFEKFTTETREAVVRAQDEAGSLGHDRIGPEHLLLAALRTPEEPGVATLVRLGVTAETCRSAVAGVVAGRGSDLGDEDAEALRTLGIDLAEIRRRAEESFGAGSLDAPAPAEDGGADGGRARQPAFAKRGKKALELTLREAQTRRDRHIGTEHLVLALLRADDSISSAVRDRLGLVGADVRELVLADLREAA